MRALWGITIFSTCISALCIFVGFVMDGAPAQAAAFGAACAFAVVPYVFTRAVQELSVSRTEQQLDRIAELLKKSD